MSSATLDRDIVADLQEQTAAVRVKRTKLGTRRAFKPDQIKRASAIFGASDEFVNATKKLLDTGDVDYVAVTGIFNEAGSYFKLSTVPYPEAGIRLIKRDKIDEFDENMLKFRARLEEAVVVVDGRLEELKQQAAERLGDLYDPADYPDSLVDEFSLDWEYPSVDPPEYLKELNPELYQQQCDRIRRKFEDAIQLTEQAFTEELSSLVGHLFDRITPQEVQIWRVTPVAIKPTKMEEYGSPQKDNDGSLIKAAQATRDFTASEVEKLELASDGRELTEEELADLDSLTQALEAADERLALVQADAIELRGGAKQTVVLAIDDQGKKTKFTFDELEEAVAWLTAQGCEQERVKVEKKTFKDTAVTNMSGFFERFRALNIGSNEELDRLVEQASQLVSGVEPSLIRKDDNLRTKLHSGLNALRDQIETMLVDRKVRDLALPD